MDRCRACGAGDLFMCLPLGEHPPANGFLTTRQLHQPEPRFPLDTHVCLACGLIQVPDHVPADFFRDYVYVPDGATTMVDHFRALAESMTQSYARTGDDLVVDIGCNNGLFLGLCRERGARVLGVDPAANLTRAASERGIEIVSDYFGAETAERVVATHPRAALIVTTNTLNHIPDLHDFMAGIDRMLAPGGVFVVEVPHSLDLVRDNEFDTVYHEHLSEFSMRSLAELYRRFGLEIFRIDALAIHGGSMRVHAQRRGAGRPVDAGVGAWLAREREAALFSRQTYVDFAERVRRLRRDLLALLSRLRAEGRTIAGYGAPAKGNTLLNYCGIGVETLPWLADRNPLKHGLHSPGMHIPVVPPARILEEQPDFLLLLAWNFADEIMAQQAQYARRGGGFIVPIPRPAILG